MEAEREEKEEKKSKKRNQKVRLQRGTGGVEPRPPLLARVLRTLQQCAVSPFGGNLEPHVLSPSQPSKR